MAFTVTQMVYKNTYQTVAKDPVPIRDIGSISSTLLSITACKGGDNKWRLVDKPLNNESQYDLQLTYNGDTAKVKPLHKDFKGGVNGYGFYFKGIDQDYIYAQLKSCSTHFNAKDMARWAVKQVTGFPIWWEVGPWVAPLQWVVTEAQPDVEFGSTCVDVWTFAIPWGFGSTGVANFKNTSILKYSDVYDEDVRLRFAEQIDYDKYCGKDAISCIDRYESDIVIELSR